MAKKALLIGINRYRIPGADLRGCVNDVKNLSEALIQYYGFTRRNIVTLLDLAATKKAMEQGIVELLRGAQSGDTLLLHYSGHGAHVPDDDRGEEADGRDEILCPTDLDWRKPLRDDWLRESFDKMKAGVKLTVIMDCCHSGSNTRELPRPDAKVVARYLPSPWELINEESGRSAKIKRRSSLRSSKSAARSKSDVVHANIPEMLITGCRDTQTSADAWIGGTYNGALTFNLVAAMKQARGNLTYRQLHAAATQRLKTGRFDQVPQLEGRRDRFDLPFLS